MDKATERIHGVVSRAEKRIEKFTGDSERLMPSRPRNAVRLSPEELKADFQLARNTPGGFQQRLREWKQQYPAKVAYEMFIEWVVANQDG